LLGLLNGWTPERRERQSELILAWKPWNRSTGPRTEEGKARSAMRGYKGAERQVLRELRQEMRDADEAMKAFG